MALTPRDVYGVHTLEEFRLVHRAFLRKNRRIAEPIQTDEQPPVVLETDGGLRLKCVCGEYPLVDPEWRMGRCFNCGLVYVDLVIPEGAG